MVKSYLLKFYAVLGQNVTESLTPFGWFRAAPPILFNRWSYTGYLTAIMDALPNSYVVGIMYIVGAALWTLECLLSIWVLQMVRHCD